MSLAATSATRGGLATATAEIAVSITLKRAVEEVGGDDTEALLAAEAVAGTEGAVATVVVVLVVVGAGAEIEIIADRKLETISE